MVKLGLKPLKRNKRKYSSYKGTVGKIANNYIIPLNARFVKSNQPNVGLLELQKQFAEEREEFNESYIEYARGMEVLIAVDCKKEPESFMGSSRNSGRREQ